jgi:hypothetical protein
MRVSIYDLDGTIICSLHRYRTIKDEQGERIDLEYWRDNEHKCHDDSLLPLAEVYKEDIMDPNCFVIIATSRILKQLDRTFISSKLGDPDYIVSREEGDTTPGGLLKIKGLQKVEHLIKNAKTVFYEDNISYLKQVCDYFQIQGVYIPSKQGH